MQSKLSIFFILRILEAVLKFLKDSNILPSVAIAQALLESASGTSRLATSANNLFGIKANPSWEGLTVLMNTAEVVNGKTSFVKAAFRKYSGYDAAIKDYVHFLQVNKRYERAGVFKAGNYTDQAAALQKAGFATDPHYAAKLIALIKLYQLDQYDPPMV